MLYERLNLDRLGKPAWLMLLGGLLFVATLVLFLLKDRDGIGAPRVEVVGRDAAPAARQAPPPRLFEKGPRVYLADMTERDVKSGPWPFTKNGTVGDGRTPIRVNDVPSPHGLGMHPPNSPGHAAVKYRLHGQAAVFEAAVAIDDGGNQIRNPAVFEVFGDGKLLWQSAPLASPRQPQECRAEVTGVDVLELRVRAGGSYWGLHAVWVEPRLLQKP
jgi:hypothetical protein